MEMSIADLWGDLPAPDTKVTPRDILERQAVLLTEKTKGLLEGQVTELPSNAGMNNYSLVAAVPTKGYRFNLVTAQYDIVLLYPAMMHDFVNAEHQKVADEEELEAFLARVLQSEKTREAIASLMRYAKESK